MQTIGYNFINKKLKRRKRDAHKGDFGKVLVYAGSEGMAGAAILCGTAALRTGSGLVRYMITDSRKSIEPILQSTVYEATCTYYNPEAEDATKLFAESDAIICGCGLGVTEEATMILEQLLLSYNKTLVLDADALNIISKSRKMRSMVKKSPASIIITPHVGEAFRLLGREFNNTSDERQLAVSELSRKFNCICVLKGDGTLTASHKGDTIYKNPSGNPGMATAGSGDVLAGIIASLAGQGYSPFDAARMGVFFHGKAGDLAARDLGEMSVMARDIIAKLPEVIKSYYD